MIYRQLPNGESQYFVYDTENQLAKAEIKKNNGETQTWEYAYDPFGRRLSKERTDKGALQSTAPKRTHFVWDGTKLLQEYTYKGNYTYIYTGQGSYEPLAQVFNNTKDNKQYLAYFHTDQIGIPKEMTDQLGNLLWFGEYTAWGKLYKDERVYRDVHQPFRLQNQYCDEETGLHYNYFRYYEPDSGRFVNQDPIKLAGGDNFYQFASNIQMWVDAWGLKSNSQQLGEAITKSTRWPGRQAHHKIPVEVFNNSPLLQRLEEKGLFKLNGKGNGIMLPESRSKGTTRSKHRGYHRAYNQALMELVNDIDKNSKCDKEKARKIQSLQSKIHKALKSGKMALYKPTTKQDWINYLT